MQADIRLESRNPTCGAPQVLNINATKAYQGVFGSATIQVVRGGACNELRNPLIVAEGLDTGLLAQGGTIGDSDIGSFFRSVVDGNSTELENFITNNTAVDYDIIYVNWDNGTDFIQRNAFVLEAVIKWVNDNKTGTNKNVVLGQSMGGLIARYALRDMENTGLNHDTGLYISHDAPHQGAHVPVGMLFMARDVVNEFMQTPLGNISIPVEGVGNVGLGTIDDLLDAPAINQMLINSVDTNGNRTNTVHTNWQTELRNFGYPRQTRNIALSNASHCASSQGLLSNQELVTVTGSGGTSDLTSLLMFVLLPIDPLIGVALNDVSAALLGILPGNSSLDLEFRANAFPSTGTARIYKGRLTYKKTFLWVLPITRTIFNNSENSQNGDKFIDNYPGGVTPNALAISEGSSDSNWFYNYDYELNVNLNFNFISATSALDVGSGNSLLTDTEYFRIYTSTNPPSGNLSIPFVNFSTSSNQNNSLNASHISFNRRNGDWLAREIDNIPNNNLDFNCTFMCSGTEISGSETICTSNTFSVPAGGVSYTWSISGSAASIAPNGNTVTVTRIGQNNGSATITVVINGGDCGTVVLTKQVWIGTPMFNSLQPIGNVNGYNPLEPNISFGTNGEGCNAIRFNAIFNADSILGYEWEKFTTDVDWSVNNAGNIHISPQCNKDFSFRVRARNICGWSAWQEFDFPLTRCTIACDVPADPSIVGANFLLSPNPVTSNILTISVKPDAPWYVILPEPNDPTNPSTGTGGNQLPNRIRVNVSISNNLGVVLMQFTNLTVHSNPASIDLSNLPSGSYYVLFEHLGQIESYTIIKY